MAANGEPSITCRGISSVLSSAQWPRLRGVVMRSTANRQAERGT